MKGKTRIILFKLLELIFIIGCCTAHGYDVNNRQEFDKIDSFYTIVLASYLFAAFISLFLICCSICGSSILIRLLVCIYALVGFLIFFHASLLTLIPSLRNIYTGKNKTGHIEFIAIDKYDFCKVIMEIITASIIHLNFFVYVKYLDTDKSKEIV